MPLMHRDDTREHEDGGPWQRRAAAMHTRTIKGRAVASTGCSKSRHDLPLVSFLAQASRPTADTAAR
jgi:hypothetical protein